MPEFVTLNKQNHLSFFYCFRGENFQFYGSFVAAFLEKHLTKNKIIWTRKRKT